MPATASTIATFTIPSSHREGHGYAFGVAATSLSLLSFSISLSLPRSLFRSSTDPTLSFLTRRPSSSTVRARTQFAPRTSILIATCAIRRIERGSLHGVATCIRPCGSRYNISLPLPPIVSGDSTGIREPLDNPRRTIARKRLRCEVPCRAAGGRESAVTAENVKRFVATAAPAGRLLYSRGTEPAAGRLAGDRALG